MANQINLVRLFMRKRNYKVITYSALGRILHLWIFDDVNDYNIQEM